MEEGAAFDQSLLRKYNKATIVELSDRARGTTPAYIVVFFILVAITPIYKELPVYTGMLGAGFILLTIIKLISGKQTPVKFDENPKFWNRLFLFHIYFGALLLSLFILGALHVFKMSTDSVFFLLLVGSIPAGATSSLAPRFKIAFLFKIVVMAPVVVWCLIDGSRLSLSFGGLFTFYFLMLVIVTKKNTKWYWVGVAQQDQIHNQSEKLEKVFKSIRKRSEYLENSASDLAGFSGEMNSSILFLSEKSDRISSESETINGNILHVSSVMDNTTNNINTIAASLEEMTATVDEISKNTHSANTTTIEASERVEEAAANVTELQTGADAIGEITEMISSIADQTKLLALNATIEAARAGEAGRGFAVVANEIKELAAQAAGSTAEINEKIAEMQDASKRTSDSIHAIQKVVRESNEMVSTIAAAVEEQSATAREISENTDMASRGVQEVNERVHENSETISNIHQELREISSSITGLGENSSLIDESAGALKEQAVKLNKVTAE